MFEKGERSPANPQVKRSFVEELQDGPSGGMPLEREISPASKLHRKIGNNGEKQYGRHAELNP